MLISVHTVTLVGLNSDFAGFFVQARAEAIEGAINSIVGTWTPSDGQAGTVSCNGADVS